MIFAARSKTRPNVAEALRRTALYEQHLALGAKMVPFAGFEMPLQYGGILREHEAVRRRAGLFDLSHMGQFELRGEGVAAWADALTVNDVAGIKPGRARYNLFCNDRGGTHDDVIFYHLDDFWYLVVNAANAAKIWELLQARRAPDVRLVNHHGAKALIAIQGPAAVAIAAPLVDADIAALKYYACTQAKIDGVDTIVARTGYTGEDGFEFFLDNAGAGRVWDRLLAAGAARGLEPAGLGARDVLRLEAGMPLYGNELGEDLSPLAAGLSWAVKFAKPAFTGKDALAAQAQADAYPRIVGLVIPGRAPARAGYPVFWGGRRVGEIRSGAPAPAVGNQNVATALVDKAAAGAGAMLEVEIRGVKHPARVTPLPFYQRPKPS